MENPIKMADLGGTNYFWKHPYVRDHPTRTHENKADYSRIEKD